MKQLEGLKDRDFRGEEARRRRGFIECARTALG
jgi:hypothetical protein